MLKGLALTDADLIQSETPSRKIFLFSIRNMDYDPQFE